MMGEELRGGVMAVISTVDSIIRLFLALFLGGIIGFYLIAITQAVIYPPVTPSDQGGWFLMGCLFLFPVASVVSLSGLLCGDLFRIFRKRVRENSA